MRGFEKLELIIDYRMTRNHIKYSFHKTDNYGPRETFGTKACKK